MQNKTVMESPPRQGPGTKLPDASGSDPIIRILTIGVFALSTGMILAAGRGDLWLDEIWSILLAREATSPADILLKFRHDNNHIINTLFQYWIGKQDLLYMHRLPAVAAGIGSIWLLGRIAQQRGRIERMITMLLAGTSYLLILYFSESRGYAPAIFCSLMCLALLQQPPQRLQAHKVAIFWMASIVGILSHATFVIILAALFCLFVAQELQRKSSLTAKGINLGLYFLVPVGFAAGFYIFFIRHIEIGGGPIYSTWEVVCRAASLTLGFPEGPLWGALALVCVAAVIAAGTLYLYREKSAHWIFFPVALLLAPFLLIVVTQPTYIYFRYFIVCIPFFYLLLGFLAAKSYRSASQPGRWMLVLIMVFFFLAQAQRIVPLLRLGRGNYLAAVQHIASNSEENTIRIGSDHDFRNKVLLAFYTTFLPQPGRLYYIDQPDWKRATPDWIITHSQNRTYRPPKHLSIPDVGKYRLAKEYRFAGISGCTWFLFRLEKKG
jgi:hypothetical protein